MILLVILAEILLMLLYIIGACAMISAINNLYQ